MSRLDNFLSLKDHAWLKKSYLKLSGDDLDLAKSFILENDHLDRASFEMAVNRMFLDKPKPKSWKYILELLTICC